MTAATGTRIQVGRRVHFFAGYGGIDADGLIVAVHGEPNLGPTPTVLNGIGRVMRHGDCKVDVILFDGRRLDAINQCSLDGRGIGVRLLDRVHSAELVDVAKRLAAKRAADTVTAAAIEADKFHEREAARVIQQAPAFYWNGIKDAKGAKLQRCFYSDMGPHGSVTAKYPPHTISIYARDYSSFSPLVQHCFAVENNSDVMTDYFDRDHIRVIPAHPLYPQVRAAYEAQQARRQRRARA